MKDEFLIDTNILVYAFDESDLKKQRIARKLIMNCLKNKIPLAISTQNLAEFFRVMTLKVDNKQEPNKIREIVNDFIMIKDFRKISYNENTLIKAIDISIKFNSDFWDSLISATMIENQIFFIYTENIDDFRRISGITSVNPFK